MKYAYWRVSSTEQNEARQLAAFEACPEEIDEIMNNVAAEQLSGLPSLEQLEKTVQEE